MHGLVGMELAETSGMQRSRAKMLSSQKPVLRVLDRRELHMIQGGVLPDGNGGGGTVHDSMPGGTGGGGSLHT
jgi:hypothetical protein